MARHASPTDDPHWRRLYEVTRNEAAADAQRCLSGGTTPHLPTIWSPPVSRA